MKIKIEIECDTIRELHSHIDHLKEQLIEFTNRKGLDAQSDDLSKGVILENDNCYGSHWLQVIK